MVKEVQSIVLVPLGGLCNRLRAILSAIALARDCRVPLRIVWLRDPGLNANYVNLFEPLSASSDVQVSVMDSRAWYRYGVPRRRNLFMPALWQHYAFDTCLTEANLSSEGIEQKIRGLIQGNVFIQTGLSFYPCDDRLLLRFFRPTRIIRDMIKSRKELITHHTIGLHIRRTDNAQSIAHSPLWAFEEAMQRDLLRNPETTFYLATDDPTVLDTLTIRFPGKVFIGNQSQMIGKEERGQMSRNRSSLNGMQEAVAELFTLIACPRFHGSYWSSFSDAVVACHEEGEADIIYV